MGIRPLLLLAILTGLTQILQGSGTIALTKSTTSSQQQRQRQQHQQRCEDDDKKTEPAPDLRETVIGDLIVTHVECADNMKSCECPEEAGACMFSSLHVEELQTFVSYKYSEEKDDLLSVPLVRLQTRSRMRDTAGDLYYLNGKGYTPTLPPPPLKNIPPEYGNCSFHDTDVTEETFLDRGCSVPTTIDGSTYRMFIGVNGQIPGPTLIVYEGQVVRIRVHNKLVSEGISIHWHGMHQKQNPWMDGVGFVTQPPITPGAYFDYVFQALPTGTHWYHSHVGAQRTDGLFGALIVMEKKYKLNDQTSLTGRVDVNDCPRHHTITLLDWQREASLDIFVRIHSTLGFFPDTSVEQVPTQLDNLYIRSRSADGVEVGPAPFWSGLMNGKGRHNQNMFSILSSFNVMEGERYRFRLIGAQSLYAFKFSIDQHRLVLIATDGHYIEPTVVDFIIIHTGERYDFILDADQPVSNYWMRAETLEANIDAVHQAEGILHYSGSDNPNPLNKYKDIEEKRKKCSFIHRCDAVNCPFEAFPHEMHTKCVHLDELQSYVPHGYTRPPPRLLRIPDQNLQFFNFGFEGHSSTSAINSMNFRFPTTPYQTYCNRYNNDLESKLTCPDREKMVSTDREPDDKYSTCIHVAQVDTSDTYKPDLKEYRSVNFVLSAVGSGKNYDFSHPIHLHGHHFRVVAIRHGKYDKNGKLVGNNRDVECNDDKCSNPTWRNMAPLFMHRRRVDRSSIYKDTLIVPAGGYVVIAFEADNPGYWFMHCHIEAHQLEGMGVIVQEFPSSQQWAPPAHINRVGNFKWTIEDYQNKYNTASTCVVEMANGTRSNV